MYSHEELKSLHGFLRSTQEGNLKKMLVSGKMTEAHLRVLLKAARAVGEDEFIAHFEAGTLPKIKLSPAESPLKESLWTVCAEGCVRVGLLSAAKKAA